MQTIECIGNLKGNSNAITRWATFGPYYAMFPIDFAFSVVEQYSKVGDYILDPFAGRCSSVYAGGVLGRNSLGIEINPLGWLYGTTKLSPAPKELVIDRLIDIYNKRNDYKSHASQMPEFYQLCFCSEVLVFLLSARDNLKWQSNSVDATLMSILLVYLHGKIGEGMSNQMRQTKAMGYTYSINWWKEKGMIDPPKIDPLRFIMQKIDWRYAKGIPELSGESRVAFGDATLELPQIVEKSKQNGIEFSLLFTSPPYWSIVNYHADQWLRLWLLGEDERPKLSTDKHKKRFNSKQDYKSLLQTVFQNSAEVMSNKSTIFVRTDARDFTYETTLETLKNTFPKHNIKEERKPFTKKTQTELFNNTNTLPTEKYGEIDIIMTRN
jgi:DNA modification methylase